MWWAESELQDLYTCCENQQEAMLLVKQKLGAKLAMVGNPASDPSLGPHWVGKRITQRRLVPCSQRRTYLEHGCFCVLPASNNATYGGDQYMCGVMTVVTPRDGK